MTAAEQVSFRFPAKSGPARTPLAERFWRHVEKSDDGCWLWIGSRGRHGYGEIASGGRRGRLLRAHRVSWVIHNGPIPDGLGILHRCDNPPCCNPAHLFLGTQADNNRDMVAKGRRRGGDTRGERNPSAKLTADQVRSIRSRCANGEGKVALARDLGVSLSTVCAIANGDRWVHIQ